MACASSTSRTHRPSQRQLDKHKLVGARAGTKQQQQHRQLVLVDLQEVRALPRAMLLPWQQQQLQQRQRACRGPPLLLSPLPPAMVCRQHRQQCSSSSVCRTSRSLLISSWCLARHPSRRIMLLLLWSGRSILLALGT